MSAEKDSGEGSDREVARRENAHLPVLLEEVLEVVRPQSGDVVLDGTVGFGGHAAAILERLGSGGLLVGIDRDEEALEEARRRLESVGHPFHLFRGLFSHVRKALVDASVAPDGGLDGILLDLGVSSYQLDVASRGFSFLRDGPLDMRMSRGEGESAAEWLATAEVEELSRVLRAYGEESSARAIARAIDRHRRREPLRTTGELARLVEGVKRRGRAKIHPATKVFQAIRIKVNRELEELESFLAVVDRYLRPGGRLAVISYHSLEDRLVKRLIRERTDQGLLARGRPELLRPSEEEVQRNPRARSARLRWAVRCGDARDAAR